MNPERYTSRIYTSLLGATRALLIASLAILPFALPITPAYSAASTQTAHAWLCRPVSPGTQQGPSHVVNTSSTASPQPSYNLNQNGCALIASGDIGFFQSQGYYYGPNTFSLVQTGITATTTASTSTIVLPASAVINTVVLAETAGNAVTGGIDLGDATSATEYASAVALGANATVVITDAALTRVFVNGGAPAADQILVKCHTSCNSASVNITIIYSYF
jgi:hypothetical protein